MVRRPLALLLRLVGLYIGFFVAPTDCQQGEAYRIIFIHVPAAWMSMFIYLVMAFWAALGLVFNTRLSSMMAQALAPTGALFTFLALWTGALWGKPIWGTWWVWDARLTSELILLFLYLGFMALQAAIDDPRRADRAGALLALVGVVNVPIIYFSVQVVEHPAPGRLGQPDQGAQRWPPPCCRACWSWRWRSGCTRIAVALARVRVDHPRARARTRDWARQTAGGAAHELGQPAASFLDMGGYGLYVWGSFGMCALRAGRRGRGVAQRRRRCASCRCDDLDDRND